MYPSVTHIRYCIEISSGGCILWVKKQYFLYHFMSLLPLIHWILLRCYLILLTPAFLVMLIMVLLLFCLVILLLLCIVMFLRVLQPLKFLFNFMESWFKEISYFVSHTLLFFIIIRSFWSYFALFIFFCFLLVVLSLPCWVLPVLEVPLQSLVLLYHVLILFLFVHILFL